MANIYVDSAAAGTGTGASWVNACTTLTAGITASAIGDDIWVASTHVEATAGAVTLTLKGTTASPNRVISVNKSGSTPPVSADILAGASISTTGANLLTITGYAFFQGITFASGTGAGATNFALISDTDSWLYFKNCILSLPTTGGGSLSVGGVTASKYRKLILDNTPMNFGAINYTLLFRGTHFIWKNTVNALTGTLPATLFTSTLGSHIDLINVDLSAAGAGKTLFGVTHGSKYFLTNCKINSAATLNATFASRSASEVYLLGTSGDNINYNLAKYNYEGSQVPDITYTKVGGASDGTTSYSHKIVTSANANRYDPFETLSDLFWVDTTGSPITATVDGILNSAGIVLPTEGDIWCSIRYFGDASSTLGSAVDDGPADILAAGTTTQGTSSATWLGSLTNETKFSLSCTFTPQKKGAAQLIIKVAKPNATFYIDPLVAVS